MSERVLVAMSGGVDSSVAAARLQRQGLDVVGVTLHLWDYPDDGSVVSRCCAPEDIHDARRVCDRLGIPHFAFDRRELFEREVVRPFVDAYLDGTTPSPCVRCNRGVKARELLRIAERLGAARVATGHYARVEFVDGAARLFRGTDDKKDQSYFLHMLDAADLARFCFPLGESTKDQVRAEALELDLPGADKGESQELCFVPTGRYDTFVEERADGRLRPGNILGTDGRVLARHQGIHRFTVGQRKHLGVAVGERAYVVGVESSGDVRLGAVQELMCQQAQLAEFVLADDQALPLECEVCVRYRGTTHAATILPGSVEGSAIVAFHQPVRAVVPGQVAVAYRRDRVLGGGTIVGTAVHGASGVAVSEAHHA